MALEIDNDCLAPARALQARSVPVGAKTIHLWGSVATGGTVATWQNLPDSAVNVESQIFRVCSSACGGLWQITTTAVEYRRQLSEVPGSPLPDSAIRQVPAGIAAYSKRTIFGLRVFANDGADLRQFDMDANQSIMINAQVVCVAWIGPSNAIDVQGMPDSVRNSVANQRAGFVVDSFLGCSLSRCENNPGSNESVLCTRHLFVAAGTQGSTEIPPYANEVTIYQEPTLGVTSVAWQQMLGDPAGGSGTIALASLPWIPGLRRTEQESILPTASHLRSDIDPDNNRFFTLVYRVRP